MRSMPSERRPRPSWCGRRPDLPFARPCGRSPRLAGFEESFRQESRKLFVERSRFLLRIVLVLYPAFWLLDLAMAPDLAWQFLQIRAAVCVLYLVSLAAAHSRRAER